MIFENYILYSDGHLTPLSSETQSAMFEIRDSSQKNLPTTA